ncbi:DedA family protein [Euzebya sp.]|uniref:DedA family protein n=1 Tax=Euzebya sp. TaxID=1971409 RepID=UPI00351184D8
MLLAAQAETQASGLFGWILDVIEALGPIGVAAMVALENVFPPIPSELVLPFAGFVIGQEGSTPWTMVLASTLGAVAGAVVLYELGRWAGLERTRHWLVRLPLVEANEVDGSIDWFRRHGTGSVLVGRCVPVVRSLVSLPAGAAGMHRGQFLALTTVGSAVWNTIWVWAGYLLGSRWQQAARYSDWISYAMWAALVALVARFVWRRRDRIGS